jgi:hypothetical protein
MNHTFTDLLRDYFVIGMGLGPMDKVKYFLIDRYRHKVSARLLEERRVLIEKANAEFQRRTAEILAQPPSRMFKEIKAAEAAWYVPVVLPLQ